MDEKQKEVNIYFVKNNKNERGGTFYNVYLNYGEKLDLNPFIENMVAIDELDLAVFKVDETFKRAGWIILWKEDKIKTATVYEPDMQKIQITEEEQKLYESWQALDNLTNKLYAIRNQNMEAFLEAQKQEDEKIRKLVEQKQEIGKMLRKTQEKRKVYKKGK